MPLPAPQPISRPAAPPAGPVDGRLRRISAEANRLLQKRKSYHHGNLRAALVVAGLEVLEDRGLDGLSLRSVAALAGVSHTAPKNHFPGVTALRTAIATEGFWRLAQSLKAGLGHDRSRPDQLFAVADNYIRFALDNAALFQLMFSLPLIDPRERAFAEAAGTVDALLSQIAARLDWPGISGPGISGPDAADRVLVHLKCLLHGAATLALGNGFPGGGAADGPDVQALLPRVGFRD